MNPEAVSAKTFTQDFDELHGQGFIAAPNFMHTVFLSRNDVKAKVQVTDLLREPGWTTFQILVIFRQFGGEMMFAIAYSAMQALSPAR